MKIDIYKKLMEILIIMKMKIKKMEKQIRGVKQIKMDKKITLKRQMVIIKIMDKKIIQKEQHHLDMNLILIKKKQIFQKMKLKTIEMRQYQIWIKEKIINSREMDMK